MLANKTLQLKSKGNYSLIARINPDDTIFEYAVVLDYNSTENQWACGHYFGKELDNALQFLNSK